MAEKYRLRFFFDYNCGGCLWSDNQEAYQKFGNGVLDTDITDLKGQVLQEAKIKLPENLKQKVVLLDKLFAESLDWDNPSGQSSWDTSQWTNFHMQAKQLHSEISKALGDEFEVVFQHE